MLRSKNFCVLLNSAVFLLAAIVLGFGMAEAVGYKVTVIDKSAYVKDVRLNEKGEIVWFGSNYATGECEVFYYDVQQGASAKKISSQLATMSDLGLNDCGQVIWLAWDQRSFELFYWDSRLGGAAVNLSNRQDFQDADPRLNQQGQIVWEGRDSRDPTKPWTQRDWEILYYNTTAGGKWRYLTNNDTDDINPVISPGGEVVWQNFDNDYELYYWKPGLAQPLRITDNLYEDQNPQFAGTGRLFWQGYDGNDEEIYYWNATNRQIINVTNNDYLDTDLVCNRKGQAAWMGYNGSSYRIYYWDAQKGGNPKVLYSTGLAQKKPKINNLGQVIWLGYDGKHWELYFADAAGTGTVYRVSGFASGTKDKDVEDYALNEKEQVVWSSCDGSLREVWYWHVSYADMIHPYRIGTYGMEETNLMINNQSQIVWRDKNNVYLAVPKYYYCDYEYHFGNGDYYKGTVVSGIPRRYFEGMYWNTTDENKQSGYYRITAVYPDMWGVNWNPGSVFVDKYYDSESKRFYNPVHRGSPVGSNYLGSEVDYILREGVAAYKFGKGYYEADVGDKFIFRYYYTNGDYYTGYVYQAPSASGYYPGQKISKKNELGHNGYYEIIYMIYTGDTAKYGKVYITEYKDGESNRFFTPVHYGQAVGSNNLGSELDYILRDQVQAYKFGKGYFEADVFDKYIFRYYYGNGDFYQGYVYQRPSASGYYPGQVIKKKNELGQEGYYHLYSFSWTGDSAKYGQVFVDYYFDSESNQGYTPVRKGQAVGTSFLGSELDHIIRSGVQVYAFGRGYYEADVGDKFFFSYVYLNGDSYRGYVYQQPSATGYYPGQVIYKKNELGLQGYYYIQGMAWTGERTKYGQVFVTNYYDGESKKNFTPVRNGQVVGTNYLGSELDYILRAGVADYKFGQGYYEADVGDKYLFKYVYGNGDYYEGYVYQAPSGSGYYPGQIITKVNELGLPGYYKILGMNWTGETTKYGQVYVTNYFDGDAAYPKNYTPLNSNSPLGTKYLGSELGYIVNNTNHNHLFGKGYYEADAIY